MINICCFASSLGMGLALCRRSFVAGRSGNAGLAKRHQIRGIHGCTAGCLNDRPVSKTNHLMQMYVKRGNMEDARNVFDNMCNRDVLSWNIMILGYAKQYQGSQALELYARMSKEGVQPSDRTFVGALKACSSVAALEDGRQVDVQFVKPVWLEKGRTIHSQVVIMGFDLNLFVGNTLVDLYAKCGSLTDAWRVFDDLPYRDVITWTAMILAYAKQEEGLLALDLYIQMHQEGVAPDQRTFVGAIRACSSLAAIEEEKQLDGKFRITGCLGNGKAMHSRLVKSGYDSDVILGNTLVDMYAKCGSLEDARRVFDLLPYRDVVTWTAIILGFAEQEESEEAFRLYAQMQEQGLAPNSFTFIAILKACGNTAALETAKELHSHIRRAGFVTVEIVENSLIDIYARCGSMLDAQQLFDALPTRDIVRWNALIAGYSRQGESEFVFRLFERLRQEGLQPDGVTFVSVLTVCSHAGLIEKGKKYFRAMNRQYGISPTIEHYTCMIDLLGRAGQLDEALSMMEKMPFQPDIVVWSTLLGSCRKWKNVEVGRHAFECLVRLDKKLSAAYVMMANIYADANMQEDHDKIQAMRKKAQPWHKQGKSWWTDLSGKVHTFVTGIRRHPQCKVIYAKLRELSVKMKEEGDVSALDHLLQEISDTEEEDSLCGHSETLAIACALINMPKWKPIRVVKNMQVCVDCHKATALISKIEQRNIICRDARRIHNYKDGKCSCEDYW